MQNTSKLKLKELQANVHDFQLVYDIAHEKQSERIASYIKKKLLCHPITPSASSYFDLTCPPTPGQDRLMKFPTPRPDRPGFPGGVPGGGGGGW